MHGISIGKNLKKDFNPSKKLISDKIILKGIAIFPNVQNRLKTIVIAGIRAIFLKIANMTKEIIVIIRGKFADKFQAKRRGVLNLLTILE
tara:strand:- start:142 stop:411 length:270 start_codon:yes stop_codon:yes gene_type:complete